MKYSQNRKLGISLVAVLMFMLAATTASIVVFRLIGSENFSSGARLKASEAYQASESGLDAVQSWLTNRANDVAALVSMYKPGTRVLLTESNGGAINVLGGIGGTSGTTGQQNFKVYLTGADTASRPMKLKFLSIGTARDGSEIGQTAIFDVDGLYRIKFDLVKKLEAPPPPALYGGSINFQGTSTISSAFVNGDWSGNPPRASGDWVITGNATLSGNDFQVEGTTCVGNNLSLNNNNFLKSGDIYAGNMTTACGIFDNVYVENGLSQASSCDFYVYENLTVVNGTASTASARPFRVYGNLVMGQDAILRLNYQNTPYNIIDGNVWIPNPNGIGTTSGNYNQILGNSNGSILAVEGVSAAGQSGGFYRYASDATGQTFLSTAPAPTPITVDGPSFPGADDVKEYCDNIWKKPSGGGCNGNDFIIEDIVKTEINLFSERAHNAACGLSNTFAIGNNNRDADITTLNNCYNSQKNAGTLYGDDGSGSVGFLVIKMSFSGNTNFNGDVLLDGKFVFIFENQVPAYLRLPPTAQNAAVLVYLKNGVGQTLTPTRCAQNVTYYNYFIYSLAPITGGIESFNGVNCPLTGTVYFPVRDPETGELTCPSAVDLRSNATLTQNNDLVRALEAAGIICDPNMPGCGSNPPPPPPPPGIVNTEIDAHWIPVSSRLFVKLESKEISAERDPIRESPQPTINNLSKSIIVMPRLVRITTNDFTSNARNLRDHYTYIYLNGAVANDSTGNAPACEGMGALGGLSLSQNGDNEEGYYRCRFAGNNAVPHSDFYVAVMGATSNPKVSISPHTGTVDKIEGSCTTVQLLAEEEEANGDGWQVRITKQTDSDNWSVSASSSCISDAGSYLCTLKGTSLSALQVCIASLQGSNSIAFSISNGNLVQPYKIVQGEDQSTISTLAVLADVERQAIPNDNTWRECQATPPVWANVACNEKIEIQANELWKCEANEQFTYAINDSEACESVGPATGAMTAQHGLTTVFQASLKWKKRNLTVSGGTLNVDPPASIVSPPQPSFTCSADCGDTLYHGATYTIRTTSGIYGYCINDPVCGNPTGVIDENAYFITVTPTGPTTITLKNSVPPTSFAGCALSTSAVAQKEGSQISWATLQSFVSDASRAVNASAGLVGINDSYHRCDNPTFDYLIDGSLVSSSSSYTVPNVPSGQATGSLTISMRAKCGGGVGDLPSSNTYLDCGTISVSKRAPATVTCNWTKNPFHANETPEITVEVNKGDENECTTVPSITGSVGGTWNQQGNVSINGSTRTYVFRRSASISEGEYALGAVGASVASCANYPAAQCPAFEVTEAPPGSSSSSAPLCQVSKASVVQGENIPPPSITCADGSNAAKDNTTIFAATGSGQVPTNANSNTGWQGTGNAYYGASITGSQPITVSNFLCNGSTYSGVIDCGAIQVNRAISCNANSTTIASGATVAPTVYCNGTNNNIPAVLNSSSFAISGTNCGITGNSNGTVDITRSGTGSGTCTLTLASLTCDGNSLTNVNQSCGSITVNSPAPSSSSGGGQCDYQDSWCGGMDLSSVKENQTSWPNTGECVFYSSISAIIQVSSGELCINGACKNNYGGWWSDGELPAKKDNGYYVYCKTATCIVQLNNPQAGALNCSGGGTPPPTPSIAVTGSATSIPIGTSYITCTGGSQLICWSNPASTFTLNGVNCTAHSAEGYGACGSGTCNNSQTMQVVVTERDIQCKGGW